MADESAKAIAVFGTILAVLVSAGFAIVLTATHDHEGAEEPIRGPRTFEVQMRSIKYAPAELTIQVGDTVRCGARRARATTRPPG